MSANRPRPRALTSARVSATSSRGTSSRRLRSYSRACSRRTIVSSHGRAAPGSLSASRERQARSSDSCTMSSAIERSRASQWAKRSRSGRSDWNSSVNGEPGSPGSRAPMDKTGDSGWGLRMALGGVEARDYTHGTAAFRQYRGGATGLIARPCLTATGGVREGSRTVADRLAPARRRAPRPGWPRWWRASWWGGCSCGAAGASSITCPTVTDNFVGWGIPAPHLLAPFVSGVEFFGGLFLLLGLLTRISAGALGRHHDRRHRAPPSGRTWTRSRRCSASMRPSTWRCSCGSPSPAPARSRSITSSRAGAGGARERRRAPEPPRGNKFPRGPVY